MKPGLYFDHNATSPLRPEARAAVIMALDAVGNPSSVHSIGREARRLVEDAREKVAALVGASPAEVVFTSGATEANNWVLRAGWKRLLVADVEHDSVLAPAAASGAEIIRLRVSESGEVDTGQIAEHVLQSSPGSRDLVSLQFANNETGVIQDIAAVGSFCAAHDTLLHCDAVQVAGRLPLCFHGLGVAFMSISAHKFGGPKGVGALVVRDGLDIPAGITGGGQERRRRAGTENVAAIAGFGAAAEAAMRDFSDVRRLRLLRDRLEAGLVESRPDALIVGAGMPRLPNTVCAAVPGLKSETMVIKFDLAGIAVSAGAACSSGKVGASHVLAAMGLEEKSAQGALRISLGWTTSEDDLEPFLKTWRQVVQQRHSELALD